MKTATKLLPIFTLALSLSATPALAIDGQALIDRYAKFAAEQGQTFEYESVEGSGDTFTVVNPTWTITGIAPIKSDKVVFSGVEEASDGSVMVGAIELQTVTSGSGDVSVTVDGATMKKLQIPKDGETDPLKQIMYYQSFETGKLTVTRAGTEIASMGSSDITLSPYSQTEPINMSMNLNDIAFDLSAVPDPNFQQSLAGMGYGGQFTGRIKMGGTWSMQTGVMEVGTYDTIIDNVGTLSIPFTITGYTAENVVEMQKVAKAMNEVTDPVQQQQMSMQMFSNLGIQNATIRFTDDSVTKRALDLASKQMGQPPEQLAAGAPFMVSAGMAQLNMPELAQQVSQAVGQFLQNPGNIAISITPAEPKTFGDLAIAGQTNPVGLVQELNLSVTANQN